MSSDDGGVGVGVGVDLLSPFSSSLSWAAAAQQPRRNNSAAALAGVNVNASAVGALAAHWTNSALPSSSTVSLLSASAPNLDESYSAASLHPSSNDFHLYAAFDQSAAANLSSSEAESDPIKAANNFIGAAMHNNFGEGDFDAAFLTHSLHTHQQAFTDALVDSHGVNGGVADDLALANSYAANSAGAVHQALSAHSLAFPSASQLTRSVSNPNPTVAALNAANNQQRVDEDGSHSHGQLVENSLDANSAFHSSLNGTLSALNGSVDTDETLLHLHQEIERSSSFPGSSSQPAANIWQNFSNSGANPSLALEAYFSAMTLDKKALGGNGLNTTAFAENLAAATNVNANHLHANLNLSAPVQSSSSIAAHLMMQQQQQSQQRAQLHSVLNGAPQNVNSNTSQSPPPSNPIANPNGANGSAASLVAPQANGSSSPSNSNANGVVNLATIAGGLNPASLLASAESPHALPLLEPLLAVSPLVNLLSMDDMKKSVQLRCVLLELDRAYKEIVHLKQENMHLQKNIDKCIKMMNLQDVDQYVNQLARMRYPGPPMGNMNERNPKANYHKGGGGGGGYNGGGNGGGHHQSGHSNSNYTSEPAASASSESENDTSGSSVHSQHNQYGRRVYYGPNSGGGNNRARGNNYRGGGGGGNRGARYHSNRGE